MDTPLERIAVARELHEVGVAIMRQNLRRRHPDEGEAQVEARLHEWIRTRRGAEHGDGPQPTRSAA